MQLQLYISTNEPDPVSFTIYSAQQTFTYDGTVTSDSVTIVDIPQQYQIEITELGITNQGIHIKAEMDRKVSVYGITTQPGSADAFTAFSCSRVAGIQEYEYYAIMYDGVGGNSSVVFVGCEDNTTITIDNSVEITLDRLQTYLHYEGSTRRDLTGAHYVSNKPISVFSGHRCTNIPSNRTYCDHLIQQIPPTVTWGTFFLSKSFEGRTSGEIYRVLAAYPSTVVNVKCNTVLNFGPLTLTTLGDWQEFQIPANNYCSIESNYPILVMEFMLGGEGLEFGDPLMMMLPPVDQYSNDYHLKLVSDFTNYVTVYVTPQFFQPQSIILGDTTLQSEHVTWHSVSCYNGSVCGYVVSTQRQAGEYHLYHQSPDARIGVSVHGIAHGGSYGYIGGIQTDINTGKLIYACSHTIH